MAELWVFKALVRGQFSTIQDLTKSTSYFSTIDQNLQKVGVNINEGTNGEYKSFVEENVNKEDRESQQVFYTSVQKLLLSGFINNVVKLSPMGIAINQYRSQDKISLALYIRLQPCSKSRCISQSIWFTLSWS